MKPLSLKLRRPTEKEIRLHKIYQIAIPGNVTENAYRLYYFFNFHFCIEKFEKFTTGFE